MELNGGIASPDGKGHDIWCLGSVVHHAAVWIMTLRLMIQIKNYTIMVRVLASDSVHVYIAANYVACAGALLVLVVAVVVFATCECVVGAHTFSSGLAGFHILSRWVVCAGGAGGDCVSGGAGSRISWGVWHYLRTGKSNACDRHSLDSLGVTHTHVDYHCCTNNLFSNGGAAAFVYAACVRDSGALELLSMLVVIGLCACSES